MKKIKINAPFDYDRLFRGICMSNIVYQASYKNIWMYITRNIDVDREFRIWNSRVVLEP